MLLPAAGGMIMFAVTGILFSSHSFAATPSIAQESLDLTGQTLTSGASVTVTGTAPLSAAHLYTYTLDGQLEVTGSGLFASLAYGSAFDFDSLISEIASGLGPYLTATVPDFSGKAPVTLVDRLATSNIPYFIAGGGLFTGDSILGMLRVKSGLGKTGIPYVEITNFKVGVTIPPARYRVDKSDYFTFASGAMTISAVGASGSSAAPDLGIKGAVGSYNGIGITGTDGGNEEYASYLEQGITESASVVLLNSGSNAGTFTLTAPSVSATTGFIQKFLFGGKDVTAAITSNGGYTTKSIGGGEIQTLSWNVTNKNSTNGAFSGLLTAVTAPGSASVSGTDAVSLYLVAP